MRRHYFIKEGAAPTWINVPGKPSEEQPQYSRLPGEEEQAREGLLKLPIESATEKSPQAVTLGNTGV